MTWIGGETGLPIEAAEKIKQRIRKLEKKNARLREENRSLKDKVASLEAENEKLRLRIGGIEADALGIRKVSDENGERIELAPGRNFITQLTSNGVLKPIEPNVLRIVDNSSYLNDVVIANITIASSAKDKYHVKELDEEELEKTVLPRPRKYERITGKCGDEIGFLAGDARDPPPGRWI